jgi:hypothetical protein
MSNTETAFGLGGILFLLVLAAIGIGFFAFWLWMLIHSITNKGLSDTEKLLWVLLVLFLPFLGPILYFFIGRPKASSAGP